MFLICAAITNVFVLILFRYKCSPVKLSNILVFVCHSLWSDIVLVSYSRKSCFFVGMLSFSLSLFCRKWRFCQYVISLSILDIIHSLWGLGRWARVSIMKESWVWT